MVQFHFPVCLIANLYISIFSVESTTIPHESHYVIGYIALLFVYMFHCFTAKICIIDAEYITCIVKSHSITGYLIPPIYATSCVWNTLSKHVVQASLNVCTGTCTCMFVCLCFYLYVQNWYFHDAFANVKTDNVYMRVLIKNFKKNCIALMQLHLMLKIYLSHASWMFFKEFLFKSLWNVFTRRVQYATHVLFSNSTIEKENSIHDIQIYCKSGMLIKNCCYWLLNWQP